VVAYPRLSGVAARRSRWCWACSASWPAARPSTTIDPGPSGDDYTGLLCVPRAWCWLPSEGDAVDDAAAGWNLVVAGTPAVP
jgi:hypothetical protein